MESTKSVAPVSAVASSTEKALATEVAPATEMAPATEVSEIAPPKGAVPKQKRNKSKGKGRNRSKSNTPKVMSPEPFIPAMVKTPKVMSPAPKDEGPKWKLQNLKHCTKGIPKETKSTEAQAPRQQYPHHHEKT
eukprot:TRINITY_DN2086_c0_g1_i1.p1 TRINITY_DN2086_c0_g1~~TRINITY_DN2086_c0_g1_i1.p1  ORF type:complete len:134 (+),score=30.71 TRINITY_DN2086_c0_g1_i1:243-644(+)